MTNPARSSSKPPLVAPTKHICAACASVLYVDWDMRSPTFRVACLQLQCPQFEETFVLPVAKAKPL